MPKRASIKGKGAEWFTAAPTTDRQGASPEVQGPTPQASSTDSTEGRPVEKEGKAAPRREDYNAVGSVEKATFYLPPRLLDELDEVWRTINRGKRRRSEKIDKSDLVREALEEHLRQRRGALANAAQPLTADQK